MAKFELNLKGIAKWAKVQEPSDNYEKTGQEWSISLYMDKENLKHYKNSGLSLKVKEDEEGSFVNFRRPVSKMIGEDLLELNPPKIYGENNNIFTGLVGNGSEVTIKVKVYDTQMGKGHQFEGMKVHTLVEYEQNGEAVGVESPY